MDDDQKLVGTVYHSAADIGGDAWQRCAGDNHPFTRFGFFDALEQSGCLGSEPGWLPHYLALSRADTARDPMAILPLFVKGHSYGEYVFDHSWAHAFERAGGTYYPKLLSAVPFTPVTGPRFLVRPDCDMDMARRALALMAAEITENAGLSSLHLNFLQENDAQALETLGFLVRHDQQFHWQNAGYADFDAFLGALSSRKRKQIKKERRTVAESDVTIRHLRGAEIQEHHWDAFFTFYMDTGARKWGTPYLNRAFFSHVAAALGDSLLLFLCERAGQPVAGALNFIGADTLYGRYWGCTEDHPYLHFEACYYQAIDFAIAHGLSTVEAGAQGAHKLARGYVPTRTYSAHLIADPRFRDAVADYLVQERREVAHEMTFLEGRTPFKSQGK